MADFKQARKTGVLSLDTEDFDDPGTMLAVNKLLNDWQDRMAAQAEQVQKDLNLDWAYGSAVWYLRTRPRWTQELEDRLIQMYRDGELCPNMNEWPPEDE